MRPRLVTHTALPSATRKSAKPGTLSVATARAAIGVVATVSCACTTEAVIATTVAAPILTTTLFIARSSPCSVAEHTARQSCHAPRGPAGRGQHWQNSGKCAHP